MNTTTAKLHHAIHEAGHAVAMLALGGPKIIEMSLVDQGEGIAGSVTTSAPLAIPPNAAYSGEEVELPRIQARIDVIQFLAGPIAGHRQREGSWSAARLAGVQIHRNLPMHLMMPPEDDCVRAHKRLMHLYGDHARQRFPGYWEETIIFVKDHWRSIDHLGRLLWEHQHIDGPEVYNWWYGNHKVAS